MTVVGKDAVHEVWKKDHDFDFHESPEALASFTSKIQQSIVEGIDSFVGECVEPKLVKDLNELLLNIYLRECANNEDILDIFKTLSSSILKKFYAPKLLSFIHPWLHDQVATFSLRFISKHRRLIINRIKPIVEKRLLYKRKLGDSWNAPVDALQLFLDDPEITPDSDPNHVNYNMIVDTIGIFMFASMTTSSNASAYALVEINKQCNGKLTHKDVGNMVKLDSFIKESLRINSNVLSVPRPCISETYNFLANGFQIPHGHQVFLDISGITFNEEFQGQNPQEFNAYRHNSPVAKADRNYLIFGFGKTACPAELENAKHKQHFGFFIGTLISGNAGIVFENKV
ncbi:8505_t:CDS:2 [Racocetra persica]|uniref:8505_t:CDS:1 n=1 Tax=Racocetra persica TaxID=160502 RepID=A0ACA9KCB0_9GLOM|nr:8505_t:CDS:2 [Racocetra persica]